MQKLHQIVCHDGLTTCTPLIATTMVPELLNRLCVAQEHDTTLGRYWLLAYSIHVDYYIAHNSLRGFLMYKGPFYVSKSLVPTILYEHHDAFGDFGL